MSSIVTTTDLTSYLSSATNAATPNATMVSACVNAVNQYIETRTHRCWGETSEVVERYDWAPEIWLRHQDVVSIESIVLGYPVQGAAVSTLTPDSYFFNSVGRVTMYLQTPTEFNPSAVNNDLVLISYSYGVMDVPDDLMQATLGIAAGFYNWAMNGQKDVVASSVGSYRLEFAGAVRGAVDPNTGQTALNPSQNITDANWLIVDQYRTRRL